MTPFFYPHCQLWRFNSFDWLNKGAFLWGGLGLAAAYAFGEAQLIIAILLTLILMPVVGFTTFAVMGFLMQRKSGLLGMSKNPVVFTLAMLLAVIFTLMTPATTAAQTVNLAEKCKHAKSMSDPCWLGGQQTLDESKMTGGHKRVGKTNIYIVGRTDDGKYNVYNLQGDAIDTHWTVGNTLYQANDLYRLLDGIPAKAPGTICESVCTDAKGRIIGVPEGYKQLAGGKKK